MVAMIATVYDGFPSLIFQPIIGALVTTLVVALSLVVGLIFLIPRIGQTWRALWFMAPILVISSIIFMCFGTHLGLTETFTNDETGNKFTGLRSDVALTSYLLMIFVVTNWPLKPKQTV